MAFIQFNANPKDRNVGDCVIRALSKATGKSWEEVYDDLYVIGRKKKRMMNDPHTYKEFLKNNNFTIQPAERDFNGKVLLVEEFADQISKFQKDRIFIIHTRKHLTVVINGDIYDTWNTSKQKTGKYYMN